MFILTGLILCGYIVIMLIISGKQVSSLVCTVDWSVQHCGSAEASSQSGLGRDHHIITWNKERPGGGGEAGQAAGSCFRPAW